MSYAFFQHVDDALRGFLPQHLREYTSRRSSRNLKVWFGEDPHAHYEVQLIRRRGKGEAIEIGFHAENHTVAKNDEVLALLTKKERTWRKALGQEAESGKFLGSQSSVWRRISEVWEDASLESESATEAAHRLAEYIKALEPVLSGRPRGT